MRTRPEHAHSAGNRQQRRALGAIARLAAGLAAPWVALVRPTAAGRMVAGAGLPTIIAGLLVMWALLSAEAILLLAWDQTRSLRPSLSWRWTGIVPPEQRSLDSAIIVRPLGEVLLSWNHSWESTPLLLAPLMIGAWAVGCHLAGTLCLVPRTYRGERLGETLRTNLKLPWVCLGLASLVLGVGGSALVIGVDQRDLVQARHWVATGSTWGFGSDWWEYLFAGTLLFGMLSIWLVVAQAERVALGAVPAQPPEPVGPRCVGCGYSLEHVPADGRCPECGESTDKSLSPLTRPGLVWQVRGGAVPFVRTAWSLLWRPSGNYARLLTRDHEERSWIFERVQFALLTVASATAMAGLYLSAAVPDRSVEAWLVIAMLGMGVWFAFCGWAGHRGMGGLGVIVAALRGPTIDGRALAGAVGYESVFLWSFFLFNFAAAFIGIHAGEDIEEYLVASGHARSFVQLLLGSGVFLGNLALSLLWCRRYLIAYRAVRWANF